MGAMTDENPMEKFMLFGCAQGIANVHDFETIIWAAYFAADEVQRTRLSAVFVGELMRLIQTKKELEAHGEKKGH